MRRFHTLILAIGMAVSIAVGVVATPSLMAATEEVLAREEYGEIAPDELRRRAEAGDAQAQTVLGVLYYTGATSYGIAQDFDEAIKWYRLAAAQDEVTAQYNLGLAYKHGHGVAQNLETALEWFGLAADQGDASAQYEVGYAYYVGDGTHRNYKRARRWYERAAKQGHPGAQHDLGHMYRSGVGVSRKVILGLAWLYVAASHEDDPVGAIAKTFVTTFEARVGAGNDYVIWAKQKAEELASEIEGGR